MFTADGESFSLRRGYKSSEHQENLVDLLDAEPNAISFFSYAYFFTQRHHLLTVPIMNEEGEFVKPSDETVTAGSYSPFSRPIFMNFWNDRETLRKTLPLLRFGHSPEGKQLVESTGYVAVADESSSKQLDLFEKHLREAEEDGNGNPVIVVLTLLIILVILLPTSTLFVAGKRKKKQAFGNSSTRRNSNEPTRRNSNGIRSSNGIARRNSIGGPCAVELGSMYRDPFKDILNAKNPGLWGVRYSDEKFSADSSQRNLYPEIDDLDNSNNTESNDGGGILT